MELLALKNEPKKKLSIIASNLKEMPLAYMINHVQRTVKKGKGHITECIYSDGSHTLSISNHKKVYKCFTCNKGGDLINFYMDFYGIEFKPAVLLVNRLQELDASNIETKILEEDENIAQRVLNVYEKIESRKNNYSENILFNYLQSLDDEETRQKSIFVAEKLGLLGKVSGVYFDVLKGSKLSFLKNSLGDVYSLIADIEVNNTKMLKKYIWPQLY